MKNINEIIENDKEFLNILYISKVKLVKFYTHLYIIFILLTLIIGTVTPIFSNDILVIVLLVVNTFIGYLIYNKYQELITIKENL